MLEVFILSFFAFFVLAIAVITIPFSGRARVKQSLGQLSVYDPASRQKVQEQGSDFYYRLIWPMVNKVSEAVKRRLDKKKAERIHEKLALAGIRRLSAEQYISIKLLIAGVAFAIFVLFTATWLIMSGHSPWWGLLLVAVLYFAPDLWLGRKIDGRQKEISKSLPDAVDVLTIAIEAGLAFDSALAKVARHTGGPLGEELGRTLWELQIGASRREALTNLAQRTNVPELQKFCSTVIQAENFGVSIAKTLKAEAHELRTKRMQKSEERAMKTPVKLVFPVVLTILPALLLVIMGPGMIRIAASILKT